MTRPPRLLLITPRFFGYENDIAAAFTRRGFDVQLIDERPSNASILRAMVRVAPQALARSVDRYYRALAERSELTELDRVLVIKGEVVPRWFLQRVRASSPDALFIYYTFDSVLNHPHLGRIIDLFDHHLSFENDLEFDGQRFVYKPLFYSPEFRPLKAGESREHDVAFIGTLHSDRYAFASRFASMFERAYIHLYVQARWYFLLQRARDRRLRSVRRSEVTFDKLDRAAVADVFRRSHAVLDMQHERQTGLTMRTFEVLASGALLVTTNPRAQRELGESGRVIVVSAEPTTAELAAVAARLAQPAPEGMPVGFDEHSVDAWVAGFADLRHA